MRLVAYTTFLFYLYIWLKVVHKMNDISKLQFKIYHNGNIFVFTKYYYIVDLANDVFSIFLGQIINVFDIIFNFTTLVIFFVYTTFFSSHIWQKFQMDG